MKYSARSILDDDDDDGGGCFLGVTIGQSCTFIYLQFIVGILIYLCAFDTCLRPHGAVFEYTDNTLLCSEQCSRWILQFWTGESNGTYRNWTTYGHKATQP